MNERIKYSCPHLAPLILETKQIHLELKRTFLSNKYVDLQPPNLHWFYSVLKENKDGLFLTSFIFPSKTFNTKSVTKLQSQEEGY